MFQNVSRKNHEFGAEHWASSNFNAQEEYLKKAQESGKHPEISRLEVKFGIQMIGIVRKENHSTVFQCSDGSTMTTNISQEACNTMMTLNRDTLMGIYGERPSVYVKRVEKISDAYLAQWMVIEGNASHNVYLEKDNYLWCDCGNYHDSFLDLCRHTQAVKDSDDMPKLKPMAPPAPQPLNGVVRDVQPKVATPMDKWLDGGYPVDPFLEDVFDRMENKDKLASCIICGRILTNPRSVAIEIGPECRKGVVQPQYIEDLKITEELREASRLYHDEMLQHRVIRAVLITGAPLPAKVLNWQKNQYWGYKNRPILYYLDADKHLNRIDIYQRKIRHRTIGNLSPETELDAHAIAKSKLFAAEETEGRKIVMNKKKECWLVDGDNKMALSFRELAEKFDSYKKGILKKLSAQIENGVDMASVAI